MEPFSVKKAVDLSGMVWFKAFKTLVLISFISALIWAVYVAYIKPHTNPTKTTSQKADSITNMEITNDYGVFHFKLGPVDFGF